MIRHLRSNSPLWRSRYAAFGAAVAVTISGGAIAVTMAAGSDPAPSSFVPISPCRIMDTRSTSPIGPRTTPLIGGQTYTIQVLGSNGNCVLPAGATAVNANVTAVNPTSTGFLTIWPSTSTQPLASSLNWVAGQAPTPNSVNVAIGSTGQVSFFANGGTVDLIADVTGYFVPGGAGAKGDTGPQGPQGQQGPLGPQGFQGPAQLAGFQTVTGTSPSITANNVGFETLNCPVGKAAVGGGFSGVMSVLESQPADPGGLGYSTQWSVVFFNNTNGPHAGDAFVICVNKVP